MASDATPRTRQTIRLQALDWLFFRDGRPFAPASRPSSGLPAPQTLAGALRSYALERLGLDTAEIAAAVRETGSLEAARARLSPAICEVLDLACAGPWFAEAGKPLVSAPVDLRRCEASGELFALAPTRHPVPGWDPGPSGLLPLYAFRQPAHRPASGFLTLAGLAQYLRGGSIAPEELREAAALFEVEARTGIGLQRESGTVASGLIYAVGALTLRPGVELVAEIEATDRVLAAFAGGPLSFRFGGEGRRVLAEIAAGPLPWPEPLRRAGRGARLLLVTPGLFDGGWKPSGLATVAAATAETVAVSGWDLARGGPKPTRFGPGAGSVYFVEGPDVPAGTSLAATAEARDGWGRFLRGDWSRD